ncbi:MAG: hypothetical protein EBR09_07785 [Proteobacteria bacterium]|nr:hypothetical protein [Pseudomonadota bacterium]
MLGRLFVLSAAVSSLFAAQANSSDSVTQQPQLVSTSHAKKHKSMSAQSLIGENGKTALIGENGKGALIGENGRKALIGTNGKK